MFLVLHIEIESVYCIIIIRYIYISRSIDYYHIYTYHININIYITNSITTRDIITIINIMRNINLHISRYYQHN